MTNTQRINNLVVGEKYSISILNSCICGTRPVTFVGVIDKKYWFTCGTVDTYKTSFNFVCPKSRLIINN